MPKALAIIPTYNEADNIQRLVKALLELPLELEVLVVDDASPDGTGKLADALASEDDRVHVIHREGKLGLGTAYKAGLDAATEGGFEFAISMDADFSHDPAHLPEIMRRAPEADLVIGSRYVPGGGVENWPLSRRLLSRTANFVARFVLQLAPRDCTAGYRCYRCEALRRVPLDEIRSSGYSFLEETVFFCQRAGFRIAEVPIVFRDRTRGQSKISRIEIYRAMFTLVRLRLQAWTGRLPGSASG